MRSFVAAHPLAVGGAGLIAVALIAFVLLYFEPQALFIDHRVDEPIPTVAAKSDSAGGDSRPGRAGDDRSRPSIRVLAAGTFQSYEHTTSGRARVLRLRDGSRYLRLDRFSTSNGPDVRVYLSAAPAGGPGEAFDDDYVELGELKGNIGDQNYAVPSDVDLAHFESAVVWCKRFSVAFGAAPLD
jgi:electron transfer DM13